MRCVTDLIIRWMLISFKDVEFASIMVQNLNNNLITAPELAELRKRLRNLDTRVQSDLVGGRFQYADILRMVKPFSSLCLGHGAITQLQPSLCVYLRKPTSRRIVCFKFCGFRISLGLKRS